MLRNIILNNPLRTLGLTATHSMREYQERIDDLEAYKAIGKYPVYDSDFSFLDSFKRDQDKIDLSNELVPNKIALMKYSLFWFSKSDDIDKMALDFISNEKYLSARKLWTNSADNYDYTKNLALLLLIKSLYIATNKDDRKKLLYLSIEKWIELCSDNNFINDHKILFKGEKAEYFVMNILLELIKPRFKDPSNGTRGKYIYYEPSILFDKINNTNRDLAEYLKENYLLEFYNAINKPYNDHEKKVDMTTSIIHLDYLDKIKVYINFIRDINKSNLNDCRVICDKVATQLNQCSISIWNKNIDTIKKTHRIYRDIDKIQSFALKIAVGSTVIDKIKHGQATQEKVFQDQEKAERFVKFLKPLKPIYNSCKKLDKLSAPSLTELKNIIYKNRDNMIELKKILNHNEKEVADAALACLRAFGTLVNNKAVSYNHNIGDGQGIEIMDMCRRINRSLDDEVIDFEWEMHLTQNRSIALENVTKQEGGLISGLFGGAIRMVKKNTSCGCHSGLNESQCCSVSKV